MVPIFERAYSYFSPTTPPLQEGGISAIGKKVLVPAVEHTLAAHVLGGTHIQKIKIAGRDVEGFNQTEFLSYYRDQMQKIAEQVGGQDHPSVNRLLRELESALEVASSAREIVQDKTGSWEERTQRFTQSMLERLKDLPIGESLLVLGGWQGVQEQSGHAMLYHLTKQKNGSFIFEIYNTGAGLQFHPKALHEGQSIYAQKLQKTVAADKMLSPLFWQGHYELYYEPRPGAKAIDGKQFYQWLNAFEDSFLKKAYRETTSQKNIELRRGQKAGICTFDSLLVYTKEQLKGAERPFYHAFKSRLQLSTLDAYWEYLQKEKILITQDLEASQAEKNLSILNLVAQEVHTLQRTLYKNRKKRGLKEDVTAAHLQKLQEEVCHAKQACHEALSSKIAPTFLAWCLPAEFPKESPAITEPAVECDSILQESPWRARDPHSFFIAAPESSHSQWEQMDKKLLLAGIRGLFSMPSCDTATMMIARIKSLAIFVRLQKNKQWSDPIVNEHPIDRRFVQALLRPPGSLLLSTVEPDLAKECSDDIRYLLENTVEGGLFHEFFVKNITIDFAKPTPQPNSLVRCANQYWTSLDENEKTRVKDSYALSGKRPQSDAGWARYAFLYSEMSEEFVALNKMVGRITSRKWTSSGTTALQLETDPFQETESRKNLFKTYDLSEELAKEFVDWLTPVKERSLRSEQAGREEDSVHFQLKLLSSADDPSLRLVHAIEFFTKRIDLMKQEKYRKFLWAIFFQISPEGRVALNEYFAKFSDKGFDRLSQFIQRGFQASLDDPEVAMSFLELGISVADYSRVFHKKKECAISAEQLEAFAKQATLVPERVDSCLVRYCKLFPDKIRVLLPLSKNIQSLQENVGRPERIQWPFTICHSLIQEHLKTLHTEQERSHFFSTYVFGEALETDVWKRKGDYVHCKQFTLNCREGTIRYEKSFSTSDLDEPLKRGTALEECLRTDLFWKNYHAKWCSIGAMGSMENGVLLVRDLDSHKTYRVDFLRGRMVGLYEQTIQKKFPSLLGYFSPAISNELCWERIPSLHSLDSSGRLERMGVSAKDGWFAEWNQEKTEIALKKEGQEKAQFVMHLQGKNYVVEEAETHYVGLDMSQSYPPCAELLKLDPQGQIWAEKKKGEKYQPKRLNCPKLGLVFTFNEDGKIFDQATGWEYLPEYHLKELPGVHPKIVLREKPGGKLRVLLPDGKMQRSQDLAKSMVLIPWEEGRNTLYALDVDPTGKIFAKTREESLYLANLSFHASRPEEALRYLKESQRTEAYTTNELKLLQRFIEDTARYKDVTSLCLCLQAGLQLIESYLDHSSLPWQKTTWDDEVSQKNIKLFVKTFLGEFPKIFAQYWDWIVHVPAALRLPPEKEQWIHRRFFLLEKPPSISSPEYVHTTSDTIIDWINQSRYPVDKDLFTKIPPLALHMQRGCCTENFLSFYAIAKEGNPKQKEQLRHWLTAVLAVNSSESEEDLECAKALFMILGLGFFARLSLPQVGNLVTDVKTSAEKLDSILFIREIVLGDIPPAPVISIPKGTHAKSVRRGRLQVQEPAQKRMHIQPLLADMVESAKQPLYKHSDLALFKQKRKETPKTSPREQILPLDSQGSGSYKAAFARLEGYVKKYIEKIAQEKEVEWEIEDPESLKKTLQDQIDLSQKDLDTKKNALLDKVKYFGLAGEQRMLHQLEISSHLRAPVEWEDLLYLFAKQDSNAYRHRLPHLTDQQAEELYGGTALCLLEQTKLQRWKRAKNFVEENQAAAAYQLLTQVKPAYPLDKCPAILLVEALSDIELRQDQIAKLQTLTDPKESLLLEAIMGSGKSEVLLPIFAQTMADGQNLVCVALPKEQMQSGGNRLEDKLKKLFSQNSVQIHWKDVSQENLQAIYERLLGAIRKGEVVRFHTDELQHFFLEEQATFDTYFQGNLSAKTRLDLFRKIRTLLHEKGIIFVDEVHLQLSRKRECQKPMDAKRTIEPRYIEIATQVQELLFEDTVAEKFFFQTTQQKKPEAVPFVQERDQEELVQLLAKAFVEKRYSNDGSKQQTVLEFLTSSDADVGNALKKIDPKEQAELSFARGQMRVILPSTLSRKWGEDYGCFPPLDTTEALPQYLAGPYRLSQPVRGSTFATPDELFAFTIQSYLMTGIPETILKDILGTLLRDAKQEMLGSSRRLEETEVYGIYKKVVGEELAKKSPLDKPDYALLMQSIGENRALVFEFLKQFILPKIVQHPLTAYVNGYSFFSRFRTVKGVSGTLPNPFTFHFRFQQAVAPEIEGEAFVLLSTQKPRWMNKKCEGLELVKQLFTEATGKERALVDQGGLIRQDGGQVARVILDCADQKEIERVIYFAGDQQMVLARNATVPERYDPAKHPKESSFTFYDQAHATGTDIPQKKDGIAWVTLSEVTSYSNACQAGFRMRGLQGGQSVQFVASYELTSILKQTYKQEDLSAAHLLRYAKHIQVKEAEADNVKAVLDQLKELFLEKCRQLLDARTYDDALFDMTLRESMMDPVKTYATSSQQLQPEVLFATVKSELLEKLSSRLTKPALAALEEEMQELIDRALDPENRQVPDLVSSHQAISEGREVEQQLEQQLEQQQQQELSLFRLRFPHGGRFTQAVPRFLPLPRTIDLAAQSQRDTLSENRFQDTFGAPIYPVAPLVRDRIKRGREGLLAEGEAEQFLKTLPKKVLFSLDAVSAVAGEPPFGSNQMSCGDVLLVPDPTAPNDPYILVLSKTERDAWLAAIQDPDHPLPDGFANCCLFSPASLHWFKSGDLAARGENIVLSEETRKRLTLTKWLMGECKAYSVEEIAFLKNWLQGQTKTKNINQVFRNWFLPQEEASIYLGSPVDICTQKVIQERLESTNLVQKSPLAMRQEKKKARSFFSRVGRYLFFPFWLLGKLSGKLFRRNQ